MKREKKSEGSFAVLLVVGVLIKSLDSSEFSGVVTGVP